jgi:Na+/H+ antiporter NhaC
MTLIDRCRSPSALPATIICAVALLPAALFAAQEPETPPIEIIPTGVIVAGVPAPLEIELSGEFPGPGPPVEVRSAGPEGALLGEGLLESGERTAVTITLPSAGRRDCLVIFPNGEFEPVALSLRAIPGWTTLLPPLLAILLALLFRQVIPALLAGVWVGAWIAYSGPFAGALRTIDHYVVRAFAEPDHVSIVIFSLMLGGMVGILSRSGGTVGLVEALTPYATNTRRGQLVTWFLGILIFFDDYANTLLVGNTMRPVTDRLTISREKLAYIVDSTAAPVTSIALVSTWIGYEVSLIGESLREMGSDPARAYAIFLQSIPYNFYPIFALLFGLAVATFLKDFGPMLKAERRARGGKTLSDTAVPLSDFDSKALAPIADKPRRWINAGIPVLIVLLITFLGLWITGRSALAANGIPLLDGGFRGLGQIFGAGDSFKALLWGSTAGCLVALLLSKAQGILTVADGLAAWLQGVKSMTAAIVILILAWSLAGTCSDLNTSGYMVASLSDHLAPGFLPVIVFILAAMTAFATGTSWGTMGILIPLAVPTAFGVAQAAGFDPAAAHRILLGAVSAVLAGAIFGDHCSPISDTTVMSSMSSGCDHVDHVRTQLPYALVVGLVAILLGYLPSGFGVPPLLCLVVGAVLLAALLYWLGRAALDPGRAA